MSLRNHQLLLVACASASALLGCSNSSGPAPAIRTQVIQLTPAPAVTTVIRQESQIVIQGGVLASCAPYGLSAAASVVDGTLVVTLTGAVAGTACPQDIVWTRGYRALVTGAPAESRVIRILHATDLSGATPEVVYEGSILP